MSRCFVILSLGLFLAIASLHTLQAQNADLKDKPLLQRLQENSVLKDLQQQFQPQSIQGNQIQPPAGPNKQGQPKGGGGPNNQFRPRRLGPNNQPNQFAPPQGQGHKQHTAEDIIRMFIPPQVQGHWDPHAHPGAGPIIDPGFDPNHGHAHPAAPTPAAPTPRPVPTIDQVVQMTYDQQRTLLRLGLMELDVELGALEVGPGWKKHLQTELLGSKLWNNGPAEPDRQTQKILQEIAVLYAGVARDPQHSFLQKLWGFKVIDVILGEYSLDPIKRERQNVLAGLGMLQTSLTNSSTGAGWITYLKLDQVSRIASAKGEINQADQGTLREIAKRFDKVNTSSQYDAIRRLSGFNETNTSIQQLVAKLISSQQESAKPAPSVLPLAPDEGDKK